MVERWREEGLTVVTGNGVVFIIPFDVYLCWCDTHPYFSLATDVISRRKGDEILQTRKES